MILWASQNVRLKLIIIVLEDMLTPQVITVCHNQNQQAGAELGQEGGDS